MPVAAPSRGLSLLPSVDTGPFSFGDAAVAVPEEGERTPLREFIREAFQVIEPGTAYKHNWHIDAIAEHLEAVVDDEILKILINIPIRCMKSLIVSVFFPAWVWTWKPTFKFLTASYAQNLATRDARKTRVLIHSRWYQERWGDVFNLAFDQNLKMRYENNWGGYRIALPSGSSGSGTGEGGDVRISDDPQNAKKIHSQAQRDSDTEWHQEVWAGRVQDPETPREIICMQRLHELDLSGFCLREYGDDYVHLMLPMEYDPNRHCVTVPVGKTKSGQKRKKAFEDPRSEDGELLWPDRFSKNAVRRLSKSLGSYGASGQLQQNPSPTEGGIFKRWWWGFWYPRDADPPAQVFTKGPKGELIGHRQKPLPPVFDQKVQSWDMAFKNTKESAYVAGQAWYRRMADAFLMGQHREKMEFPETVKAVIDFSEDWPETSAKYVEDKANGPAVMATLRNRIPGLIAVDPEGDKIARAHAVTPYVESGNIWLPHPHLFPWVQALIDECAKFPTGTYADQVDALTQALNRLFKGGAYEDELGEEDLEDSVGTIMGGTNRMTF